MTAARAILLPEELESLRLLAVEMIKRRVPTGHGKQLVRCGFATDRAGRVAITMTGRAKLVIEVTRNFWIPALV